MGFITNGQPLIRNLYNPTQYRVKKAKSSSKVRRRGTPRTNKTSTTSTNTTTTTIGTSILEKLPLELIYEIFIFANAGNNLPLVNKFFNKVLRLSNNEHLQKKLLRNHIADNNVLDWKLLNYTFITKELLFSSENILIDEVLPFDEITHRPISGDSIDKNIVDLPNRLYSPQNFHDLELIDYLITDTNVRVLQIAHLLVNIIENDELDEIVTLPFIQKITAAADATSARLHHEDTQPIVRALELEKFQYVEWLITKCDPFYELEKLNKDHDIWDNLIKKNSNLKLLQFLISLGLQPDL